MESAYSNQLSFVASILTYYSKLSISLSGMEFISLFGLIQMDILEMEVAVI
jgi:hypothetical protein